MQLVADPFLDNIKFLFQLFDNTLAYKAKGSDVIRKDGQADAHYLNLPC